MYLILSDLSSLSLIAKNFEFAWLCPNSFLSILKSCFYSDHVSKLSHSSFTCRYAKSLGIEARDQPFGIAVRFMLLVILFIRIFMLLTCHPVATLLPGLFHK